MPEVVVELRAALRSELKEPMGQVYSDTDSLLADTSTPLIAVGDIVTYHLLEAGRRPDVALVDERTERSVVDEEIQAAIGGFDRTFAVVNPPATLTASLLGALQHSIDLAPDVTSLIDVDGEEDLAALPAILAAPSGASVVYGQPGQGMVLVDVDECRNRVRDLLSRMEGDTERLWTILGLEG